MAKYYGKVGYVETVETKPGVWTSQVTERYYSGDVVKNISKWSPSSDSTNGNLNVDSQISIVADPYAYQNFRFIKYVEFMGANWNVTSVEPKHPRLILTVGGVYNGRQA